MFLRNTINFVNELKCLTSINNSNYIFPSEGGFAALAIDISDGVQSREQDTLLGWTATHIHPTGDRI
jgi:hypothetical protein